MNEPRSGHDLRATSGEHDKGREVLDQVDAGRVAQLSSRSTLVGEQLVVVALRGRR